MGGWSTCAIIRACQAKKHQGSLKTQHLFLGCLFQKIQDLNQEWNQSLEFGCLRLKTLTTPRTVSGSWVEWEGHWTWHRAPSIFSL